MVDIAKSDDTVAVIEKTEDTMVDIAKKRCHG